MTENMTKPTSVPVEGFIDEIDNPRRRMDARRRWVYTRK